MGAGLTELDRHGRSWICGSRSCARLMAAPTARVPVTARHADTVVGVRARRAEGVRREVDVPRVAEVTPAEAVDMLVGEAVDTLAAEVMAVAAIAKQVVVSRLAS